MRSIKIQQGDQIQDFMELSIELHPLRNAIQIRTAKLDMVAPAMLVCLSSCSVHAQVYHDGFVRC